MAKFSSQIITKDITKTPKDKHKYSVIAQSYIHFIYTIL